MSPIFLFLLLTTESPHWQTILIPPEDVTGKFGGNAQFKCEVDFEGHKEMAWTFNQDIIYSYLYGNEKYPMGTDKYSVEQNGRTFELSVKDLHFSDGGIYTCNVLTEAMTANLFVIGTPHLFNSTSTPYPVEGSTEEFICTAQWGGPSKENFSPDHYPKLQIFLDGSPLNGISKEQELEIARGYYNLTQIYNMTLEPGMDGKQLMCTIETMHPAMNESVTSELDVFYSVHNISYTPRSEMYEVGTIITCTANGNPRPDFIWNDLKHKKNAIHGPALEITDQMVGKNNIWRCTAWNNISGNLSVDAIFEGESKSIVIPPKNVTGKLGGTAVFKCEIDFGDHEEMAWTFNQDIIYSYLYGNEEYPMGTDKYTVAQDERTFELSVKDLHFSDGGEYKCNVLTQTVTANLIIIGTPHLFNSTSTPYPVEGSDEEFICTAQWGGPSKENISPDHYPKLQMFLDGSPLNGISKEQEFKVETGYYNLTQIHSMTLEQSMDGMQLMCTIETMYPAMNETVNSELTVLYSVRNISYTPQGEKYIVGTIINCTAIGNPGPGFLWNDLEKEENLILGSLLEVTGQMVGKSNIWRCTAWNYVNRNLSVDAAFEVFFEEFEEEDDVSDSWKIGVGIVVFILVVIGALMVHIDCRIWLRKRNDQEYLFRESERNCGTSDYPSSADNCETSFGTSDDVSGITEEAELLNEEETTEVQVEWIDPSDNTDQRLEFGCIVIVVPAGAISQSVMISVKEIKNTRLLERIRSRQYDDDLRPVIQLSMAPLKLKLHKPVRVSVKRNLIGKACLIFKKGRKQWTDITQKCNLKIQNNGISLTIKKFAVIEILNSNTEHASRRASEVLNEISSHDRRNSSSTEENLSEEVRFAARKRCEELKESIDDLKDCNILNTVTANKIKKISRGLPAHGYVPPDGPSALAQLMEKAKTLTLSDNFMEVTEVMAEKHVKICKEKREDPLLRVVELLKDNFNDNLTGHPKKLLNMIDALLPIDCPTNTRSRCFSMLVTNTEEWKQIQGEPMSDEIPPANSKHLQCDSAFIKVLKDVGEMGIEPAWSPDGTFKSSNLYSMVALTKHVISQEGNNSEKENIMDALDVIMADEKSLDEKNVDDEGMTVLHVLVDGKKGPLLPECEEPLLQIISNMKTRNLNLLDTKNHLHHTPLHTFVISVLPTSINHVSMTERKALKESAKKWFKDKKKACTKIVKCLISSINTDIRCMKKKTPLQELTECADILADFPDIFLELVKCLKSKLNIDFRKDKQSPLSQVSLAANTWAKQPSTFLEVVKSLKSLDNINKIDYNNYTPLHTVIIRAVGAWKGHTDEFLEVIKWLKSEYNLDLCDKQKYTPLHSFIIEADKWEDQPEKFLLGVKCLQSPSNIDVQNYIGYTPLHTATADADAWKCHPDIFLDLVKWLKSNVNLDIYDKNKRTSLFHFIDAADGWRKYPDKFLGVVQQLKSPSNIDIQNDIGYTPLHAVTLDAGAWKGQPYTFVDVLKSLKSNSNINFYSNDKKTALHQFVAEANNWKEVHHIFLEVVRFLRSDLNINLFDDSNKTPLLEFIAVAADWKDYPEAFLRVIECLVSPDNINHQHGKGYTALHLVTLAAGGWSDHPAKFLEVVNCLKSDSNINYFDRSNCTPLLHFTAAAAEWKDHPKVFLEVVNCLKSPENIDYQSLERDTPLHKFICEAGEWSDQVDMFLEVVLSLKSHINFNIKAANGLTPLHQMNLAADKWNKHPDKFQEVVEYLKSPIARH